MKNSACRWSRLFLESLESRELLSVSPSGVDQPIVDVAPALVSSTNAGEELSVSLDGVDTTATNEMSGLVASTSDSESLSASLNGMDTPVANATTWTVSSLLDDGTAGTLRYCITRACSHNYYRRSSSEPI